MNRHEYKRQSMRELELLAERYFDCILEEEEEERFLRLLAMTDMSSPVIDEARAVAGYCVAGKQRSAKTFVPVKRLLHVAAAIAFIIMAGVGYISYGEMPEEECYAYVGGQRIEDDDDVFGLMHHDLSVLEEASADVGLDVRTQMQMMGDVLETVEF